MRLRICDHRTYYSQLSANCPSLLSVLHSSFFCSMCFNILIHNNARICSHCKLTDEAPPPLISKPFIPSVLVTPIISQLAYVLGTLSLKVYVCVHVPCVCVHEENL
jgi:hypothetical protein